MARDAHGLPQAGAVEAEEDGGGDALDLHRALEVVAQRVERAVGRDGDRRADAREEHGEAGHGALECFARAAPAEEPGEHDRHGDQREALDEGPEAEQGEPRTRPAGAHEP